MKKKLLALCLLLCLVLTGCDVADQLTQDPAAQPTEIPAADESPVAEQEAAAQPIEADAAEEKPMAYLVVTVAEDTYEPIALTEPGRYRITRGDYVNVIEVTEDSVWMAESTCDNQDCIYQGTVTLENKDERVLKNMILCLPNEVILELYTYEELLAAYPGWQGGQAQ